MLSDFLKRQIFVKNWMTKIMFRYLGLFKRYRAFSAFYHFLRYNLLFVEFWIFFKELSQNNGGSNFLKYQLIIILFYFKSFFVNFSTNWKKNWKIACYESACCWPACMTSSKPLTVYTRQDKARKHWNKKSKAAVKAHEGASESFIVMRVYDKKDSLSDT